MQVKPTLLLMGVCLASLHSGAQAPVVHRLKASPSTVSLGFFDASAKPVLTVASGDVVQVETILGTGEFLRKIGVDEQWITAEMRELDKVKDQGPGAHAMVGPIYVTGATPGDVLEVAIKEIRLREAMAVNAFFPGGGTLPAEFPYSRTKVIPLDLQRNVARLAPDVTVPLRPFFGNLAVAPPALLGRTSSNPPGFYAGNMDNKDLVAGTTLYLPVQVPGALFYVGDGHAAQGNGEVDGSAVETALVGTLQLTVRKDLHNKWPRAETPTHLMTMGFSEDLDEAARQAAHDMIALIVDRYHLSADDAYMIASVAADLHVTQLVDGVKGVHAMLPKAVFQAR